MMADADALVSIMSLQVGVGLSQLLVLETKFWQR